jgi:predicted ATP-grasp superfamily ATP-dependent carboligase
MGEKKLPSAFVLNMDTNGLGIARTLGRRGIPVVGVDHRPGLPGMHSRFVRPLLSPSIQNEPGAVLETLMEEGEKLDERPVLFPASDPAVLLISRNRNKLSSRFELIAASEKVQEAMINKRLQYEEAIRLGIPMTETFYPTTMKELEEGMRRLRFPAFIKPLYSHLWHPVFGAKGFVVKDAEDLREKMTRVFAAGQEVMVQDIIWPPGKELYNAGAYIGRNGYVSPVITWQKVRQYPPNFGVASLASSCHQPEVARLGMKFMKGLGYQGIASVGFKKDERDGGWKLIELNARTWMAHELSDRAGTPLVYLEYLDLTNLPKPPPEDFRDGVRWWDGLSDAESFWRLRRRGEITFAQWVRSWYGADVYSHYAPDDPWPVLRRYGYGVKLAKLAVDLLRMKIDEDDVRNSGIDVGAIKYPASAGAEAEREKKGHVEAEAPDKS